MQDESDKQQESIPRVHSAPNLQFHTTMSESDDLIGRHSDTKQRKEDNTLESVAGKKKVDKTYTVGCFDLFHRGHRTLLKYMRILGKEVYRQAFKTFEGEKLPNSCTPTMLLYSTGFQRGTVHDIVFSGR